MTPGERPPWLVRQENGEAAEVRTRAFLMDRFWILERSVDVEGADLIIQRRLTARSLLDREPPRLGYVQSKYFQDENTTQYVHREYVLDPRGYPRAEFFVICHLGVEDTCRAFFVSAKDIIEHFKLTPISHSKPDRYALPGSEMLSRRFEILDRRRVLERIEQALRNAEFTKNREFLYWALPSVAKEDQAILEDYLEPIHNYWGNIPSGFEHLKREARSKLWPVEEEAELLRGIIESNDPVEALSKAEDWMHEFRRRDTDRLFDDDFLRVAQNHKKRVEQLRDAGLLGANAALWRKLVQRIVEDVAPQMPVGREAVFLVNLDYHPDDFSAEDIRTSWTDTNTVTLPTTEWFDERRTDSAGLLIGTPGHIEAYIMPSCYSYDVWKDGKYVGDERPWKEKFCPRANELIGTIMTRVLELRFGEV